MLRTNVSWIELVLRPSGARKPLTASMDHAKMGRVIWGRENAYSSRGKGFIYMRSGRLIAGPCRASSDPKYWHEPIKRRRLVATEAWSPTNRSSKPCQIGKKATTVLDVTLNQHAAYSWQIAKFSMGILQRSFVGSTYQGPRPTGCGGVGAISAHGLCRLSPPRS
jgi:hypothetical protein